VPSHPRAFGIARRRRAILVLLAACAAACKAPPLPRSTVEPAIQAAERAPRLTLGPNDVLGVVVPGRPEFSVQSGYRISAEGALHLPLVGAVHVAGLSIEEAAAAIEAAVAEYVNEPRVGLTLIEARTHLVHVLGRVGKPGEIVLDGPLTALEALARAGGLRGGARRTRIALLRRVGDADVEVYLFSVEPPDPKSFIELRPGDVVFVPRSGAGVFQDEALPVLQGIGFTTSQIAAITVAADRL